MTNKDRPSRTAWTYGNRNLLQDTGRSWGRGMHVGAGIEILRWRHGHIHIRMLEVRRWLTGISQAQGQTYGNRSSLRYTGRKRNSNM